LREALQIIVNNRRIIGSQNGCVGSTAGVCAVEILVGAFSRIPGGRANIDLALVQSGKASGPVFFNNVNYVPSRIAGKLGQVVGNVPHNLSVIYAVELRNGGECHTHGALLIGKDRLNCELQRAQ